MCLFPQQVVLELMVVCGEGGEVLMVPTQQGQRKPKRPTHKDPREEKKKKKKKKTQQRNIANGAK